MIYGAHASSAPIKAQINYKGYMETVGKVVKKVFPECYGEIKKASKAVDQLVETKQYSKLETLFRCECKDQKVFSL